jgi:protein tyrosine/serine phosphatase
VTDARWTLGWVLLLLVPVGCGLGFDDGFAPLTPTDNFRVLEPGRAYRSGQVDADTMELLVNVFGIRTVINLRGENVGEPWYDNEKAVLDANEVELVDVRMSAHALPPRAELLKLYDAFLSVEEPILIHCSAGADRTGAASALWRMVVLGHEREDAAGELCVCYGHFEAFTPEMDELVRIFQPDRTWIEQQYPVP